MWFLQLDEVGRNKAFRVYLDQGRLLLRALPLAEGVQV
jgi:hypothetical protein